MKTQILAAALLASALAAPAQAADRDFSAQIFAVMGDTIAAQGNQALREIRSEVRRNLVQALKPLLPQPDAESASAESDNTAARSAVQ